MNKFIKRICTAIQFRVIIGLINMMIYSIKYEIMLDDGELDEYWIFLHYCMLSCYNSIISIDIISSMKSNHSYSEFLGGFIFGVFLVVILSIIINPLKNMIYKCFSIQNKKSQSNISEIRTQQSVSQLKLELVDSSVQTLFPFNYKGQTNGEPINLHKLKQIKGQLEKVFIHDKFLVIRQPSLPYSIITPSYKVFSNVGGVSCWRLERMERFQLQNSQEENMNLTINSIIETEADSSLETSYLNPSLDNFNEFVENVVKDISKREWLIIDTKNTFREISLQIYNCIKKQYQRFNINVIVTERNQQENKWTAVWSAKTDHYMIANMKLKQRRVIGQQQCLKYSGNLSEAKILKKQIVSYQSIKVQSQILIFIN